MALTYALLLKLNRGAGTVVERLLPEERASLRVQTPIIKFLEDLPGLSEPRHTFLTGNAGDGKTFAVQAAMETWGVENEGFEVILDASSTYSEAQDPLGALAGKLESALSENKRLLVAINRGQLERLSTFVTERDGSAASPLSLLLEAARGQLTLRVDRQGDDMSEVLVVDLGLQDVLSPAVLFPFFETLAGATEDSGLSASTRSAFLAARASLAAVDGPTRRELARALTALRGTGLHVTMRQLWTLGAYLLTGWREPTSSSMITLEDAVVARLYSPSNSSPIRAALESGIDPALSPWPQLAQDALTGRLLTALGRHAELAPLLAAGTPATAFCLLRVGAAFIGAVGQAPPTSRSPYFKLVMRLKESPEPWPPLAQVPRKLMAGIYGLLEYPRSGPQFPIWQYLCYESREATRATRIAEREASAASFRVGLPRPPQGAIDALEDWSPPYVILEYKSGGGSLRLPPALFNLVYSQDSSSRTISGTTRLTLTRWVSSILPYSERSSGSISLMAPETGRTWRLERDDLDGRLSLKS